MTRLPVSEPTKLNVVLKKLGLCTPSHPLCPIHCFAYFRWIIQYSLEWKKIYGIQNSKQCSRLLPIPGDIKLSRMLASIRRVISNLALLKKQQLVGLLYEKSFINSVPSVSFSLPSEIKSLLFEALLS